MGSQSSKNSLRDAITYLNVCADPIGYQDDKFWDRIWTYEGPDGVLDIKIQEIRMLRDGAPRNFSTLLLKLIDRIYSSRKTLCNTYSQQLAIKNAARILTKLIPCIYEDAAWHDILLNNETKLFACPKPEMIYPKKCDKDRNFRAYVPIDDDQSSFTCQDMHNENQDNHNCDDSGDDSGDDDDDDDEEIDEPNGHQSLELNSLISTDETTTQPGSLQKVVSDNIGKRASSYHELSHKIDHSILKGLILSCCDLLFCPGFTVPEHSDPSNNADLPPEDIQSLASCDYVWEPGVGFDSTINSTTCYDKNRIEILNLLLVCFSKTLYHKPKTCITSRNLAIEIFTSANNRHALPLFTSLLNILFGYRCPTLLQFNGILYEDNRRQLVQLASQILIVAFDYKNQESSNRSNACNDGDGKLDSKKMKNLFIEYMTRVHRPEDFAFIINGFKNLISDQLERGYLVASNQALNLEQESLVLLWMICNLNSRFMNHLMKSAEILDIIVPILYHLSENFQNQSKTVLIHLGVFNLLLFSSHRNFAVRLSKPYQANILPNLPSFSGSHADLMIIVFQKLILYGFDIHQLFEYMTTIIVNISPYIKALSMVASKCLVQLFEIFSSPEVIFTEPNYHLMVINLLETFNNLIQYQFDGNANLICAILIRKDAFVNLSNLPTSDAGIRKVLKKLCLKRNQILKAEQAMTSDDINDDDKDDRAQTESPLLSKFKIATSATIAPLCDQTYGQTGPSKGVSLIETPIVRNVIDTMSLDTNTRPGSSQSELSTNLRDPIEQFKSNSNGSGCIIKSDGAKSHRLRPSADLINQIAINQVIECQAEMDQSSASKKPNVTTLGPWCGDVDRSDIDKSLNVVEYGQESGRILAGREDNSGINITDISMLDNRGKASITSGKVQDKASSSGCSSSSTIDERQVDEGARKKYSKWRPTSEFLLQWKSSLPLHTTLKMIEVLKPQLERCKDEDRATLSELEIIKFVQNGTLVGLLPVPHPILIRRYIANEQTNTWFRSCIWALIYVKDPFWLGTSIRLMKGTR